MKSCVVSYRLKRKLLKNSLHSSLKPLQYIGKMVIFGGVAERFNAAVLKTVVGQPTGSSNLSPSVLFTVKTVNRTDSRLNSLAKPIVLSAYYRELFLVLRADSEQGEEPSEISFWVKIIYQ